MLRRTACESPAAADKYVSAAKLWYRMHQIIHAVPYSHKYDVIMNKVGCDVWPLKILFN